MSRLAFLLAALGSITTAASCTFLDNLGDLQGGGGPGEGGGPSGGCPSGMIPVSDYCIDATEVTNGQYYAFLQTHPDESRQLPPCDWNLRSSSSGFVPQGPPLQGGRAPTGDDVNKPVLYTNWCSAKAYCEWAGKHLCGARGGNGAQVDEGNSNNAAIDEWYNACSNGGALEYPYGPNYVASYCNVEGLGKGAVWSVGSESVCQGPKGVFDLSGNAEEWESSCSPSDGGSAADDTCVTRGGSYYGYEADVACTGRGYHSRYYAGTTNGVRCCK